MKKTVKLARLTCVLAIGAMMTITLGMSQGLASNHKKSDRTHPTNPAIDMIVTGSNKNSVKVKNPSIGKNECGLCYHRDIVNKHDENDARKPTQAYPGE